MFDLITGKTAHTPRHQAGPIVVSVVAHVVLIGAVFIGPVMFVVAPSTTMKSLSLLFA